MFILSFVLKRLMKLRTFLVLNKVRVSAACPNIATEPPPPPPTPRSLELKKIITPKRDDEHRCPFPNVYDGMYKI